MNHLYRVLKKMVINNCPGCGHVRDAHKEGTCWAFTDMVTAGGETHSTLCGDCPWAPYVNENGSKGWRHRDAAPPPPTFSEEGVETAALEEVERVLGLRS